MDWKFPFLELIIPFTIYYTEEKKSELDKQAEKSKMSTGKYIKSILFIFHRKQYIDLPIYTQDTNRNFKSN